MSENTELKKRFSLKPVVVADCIIIVCSLLFYLVSRFSPEFCDFYAEKVYPIWVGTIGRMMGLFSFSVVEILLYVLIIYIVVAIMLLIRRKTKNKRKILRQFLTIISILLCLYVFNCGINYGHSSYSVMAKMEMKQYTTQELYDLCFYLTQQVNYYSKLQDRDSKGIMYDKNINEKARKTMVKVGESDSLLRGYYPRPKGVLKSEILSYQQLAGIYSPFTIEANYNKDMPYFEQAFTACHELSHLRGYMQEEEANYIAFISCVNSDYDSFKYGGYIEGWLYATNELLTRDRELYMEIASNVCDEVMTDLEYNNDFWDKYSGKVAEISDKVNDTYLKANGQNDGVLSYDRVVGMMVEWYQKR